MPIPRPIFEQIKRLIPPLDGSLHKGQSGRVGVLGGALDYTGAPFFAAMSALRFGADLSHVICSPTAGGAIKSYSPDLIVHPVLREDLTPETVKPELQLILSRLHVLVVGPGLGRESYMQSYAKLAISISRKQGMYVVLDADALYLVGREISIIHGYHRAIITPNVTEFRRLSEQVGVDPQIPEERRAAGLSRILGGVTVLQKGRKDLVATETSGKEAASQKGRVDSDCETVTETVEVDIEGGAKRCGGQGDVLSGCVGTFLAWGKCYEDGSFGDNTIPASRVPLLAALAGSMVTRTASKRAFLAAGRGVVTEDMLSEIGEAFAEVFGSEMQGQQSKM